MSEDINKQFERIITIINKLIVMNITNNVVGFGLSFTNEDLYFSEPNFDFQY